MTGSGIFLLFLLGLVVVGGIAYLQYLAAKKRREEFAALAAQRGWTYTAQDERWTEAFEGAPFGRGHTRRAINVLTGQYDGRPLVAFDYKYSTTETTTVNGRTQTRNVVHPFSVVAIDVGVRFPELDVSPEGFFSRIVDTVTGGDIDFESEDFNRMFRVRCADRKFASDVVHPRMMELLMQHPDTACRFTGTYLLAADQGDHSQARLLAQLALLDAVVDQVPDFVWRDTLGSVPPAQPSSRAAQDPAQNPAQDPAQPPAEGAPS